MNENIGEVTAFHGKGTSMQNRMRFVLCMMKGSYMSEWRAKTYTLRRAWKNKAYVPKPYPPVPSARVDGFV